MIMINEYMGGSRGSCGNVIKDPFQHSTYLNTKQRSMITSIVSSIYSGGFGAISMGSSST